MADASWYGIGGFALAVVLAGAKFANWVHEQRQLHVIVMPHTFQDASGRITTSTLVVKAINRTGHPLKVMAVNLKLGDNLNLSFAPPPDSAVIPPHDALDLPLSEGGEASLTFGRPLTAVVFLTNLRWYESAPVTLPAPTPPGPEAGLR